MKLSDKNKDLVNSAKMQDSSFFSKVKIPFEKDKQEVWDLLESKISAQPNAKKIVLINRKIVWAIAATFLLLLSTSLVMRFYTKSLNVLKGEHLTALLPDGSRVELNAESTLKYHPYWWMFRREIQFSGEGYFEIEKGSKLEISSSKGKTIVLGTSFNIYTRNDQYKVTCLSGKVKVVSASMKEAILTPDYHAELDENGNILVNKLDKPEGTTQWINEMFKFSSEPLLQVIEEIERQYNIVIKTSGNFDYLYTGYFAKSMNPDQVLNLICKPFGLTFVKKSETEFMIFQK